MNDEDRTECRPGPPAYRPSGQKYGAFVRLSEFQRRALTWSEKYNKNGYGIRLQIEAAARRREATTDVEIDDELVARAIDRALELLVSNAENEYAKQQLREGRGG